MSQNHNPQRDLTKSQSVALASLIASLISIFVFVTGVPSLPELREWLNGTKQTNFGAPAERANSLAPSSSATALVPTPTPIVIPTDTAVPLPTITPLPTVVVAASPTCETGLIDRTLVKSWQYDNLGCPKGPSFITWAAWQPFENGGHMFWRKDTNLLYVFARSGWYTTPYDWKKVGEPELEIPPSYGSPSTGTQAPKRGFGYAWKFDEQIFHALGWAIADEKGFCAIVQDFEQGFVVGSSTKPVCATGDNGEDLFNNVYSPGWSMPTFNAYANRVWE